MTETSAPYNWPLALFDPGSFKLPTRKIERVYLACTCWDSMAFRGVALAEEINRWHEAEGWHGITWHFIVDKSGNVVTGRPLDEAPILDNSAINGSALAIAVHGLWHFTEPELTSVRVLCEAINRVCLLEKRPITFHGVSEIHRTPNPTFDYV